MPRKPEIVDRSFPPSHRTSARLATCPHTWPPTSRDEKSQRSCSDQTPTSDPKRLKLPAPTAIGRRSGGSRCNPICGARAGGGRCGDGCLRRRKSRNISRYSPGLKARLAFLLISMPGSARCASGVDGASQAKSCQGRALLLVGYRGAISCLMRAQI